MAMPKNILPEALVQKWGLVLDEEVGAYFLNGRRIPDLPQVEGDYYLESTGDSWTASKLKLFKECPFSAFLKYILKLDLGDKSDASHFIIGNAVDYFVSYGAEKFEKKYYIPGPNDTPYTPESGSFDDKEVERLTFDLDGKKAALADKRIKYPKRGTKGDEAEIEALESRIRFAQNVNGREILAGADSVLVMRIIREVKRQTLFDLHNKNYNTQVRIKADFKGIPISGTLDREDPKNDIIRDTKTIADQMNKKFRRTCNFSIQEYGYDFSTAFYEYLRWAHNKAEGKDVRSKVILDFFGKASSIRYLCYEIPTEILNEQREIIIQTLNFLKRCIDEKDFPTKAEIDPRQDAFLESPYYEYNPASIQKEALIYQPFDLDH